MGMTAESLGEQYGISREDADRFALASQQRWAAAQESGGFADEIAPIDVTVRRKTVTVDRDEHPRPETTLEILGKLPPVFKDNGLVTAGNASGICDGAAALVLAGERFAAERGLAPMGRLVAWAAAGVDPRSMGMGPAPASRRALERAGLALEEMDLIEVNEAFAAQYLAVEQELGLDRERTNLDGGAVALGHPLGASGARITLHLLHALRRRGGRYGLGTACIGGGQGIAVIVEAT
jgi:acetyl-CoA acetyltransferase family protein